jgi:hypothetical protein
MGWNVQRGGEWISLDDGVLTIDHPQKRSTVLTQCLSIKELKMPLLLLAEGRSLGVVRGRKPWHEARVGLVGYDAKGEGLYQVRTRLFGLEGDQPWHRTQGLFTLPEVAQQACLEISLYAVPGRFQVRQLSLTGGAVPILYQVGRYLLLAGWLVLALWLTRPLYRHYRNRRLGSLLLMMTLVLLAGVLMPHEIRQQFEEVLLRVLTGMGLPFTPNGLQGLESGWALWPAQWDLSKYSHLLGFSLLAAVLSADRQVRMAVRLIALLLLALTTEILQFFVQLRTPRLSDLMIDAMGIAIGMGLAALIYWIQYRSIAREGQS